MSGTAGTGKTSLAATFAQATCRRGDRCLYISLEEFPSQILRNMSTIGIDLQQWVNKGHLQFQTVRAFHFGLEMHLARTIKFVSGFAPQVVIIDPVSGLDTSGTAMEVEAVLMRLVDFLKRSGVTVLLTDLKAGDTRERTEEAISSLVDTWLVLRDIESNGERNCGLHILKSRGMAHSNQVREFILSDTGVQIADVYIGPNGMLTGSARVAQEARRSLAQSSSNLRKHLADRYHIEVIDLMKNPQLAQGHQILALPTLVRKLPSPIRKIIGNLSDSDRVLVGLDLRQRDLDGIIALNGNKRVE